MSAPEPLAGLATAALSAALERGDSPAWAEALADSMAEAVSMGADSEAVFMAEECAEEGGVESAHGRQILGREPFSGNGGRFGEDVRINVD